MADEPNVGTGNYSKKADAIITGGAYDDEKFNEMRNACAELPENGGVPWLRPNMSTPTPPIGSVAPSDPITSWIPLANSSCY